ncbi:MAG: glycosyltransferase family 39 protein [Candidatus Altiarchaeota archaeon]|nr:glycosyltransferase family 39 protein [Candidatus Altiarchaeota archaeon]
MQITNLLKNRVFIIAFAVFLFSLAFRLTLVNLPLQYDEGTFLSTGYMMQHNGYLLYEHRADNKPPLIYAIPHLLSLFSGSSSILLYSRLLTAVASSLSAAVVFLIGRRVLNERCGVMAAALFLTETIALPFSSTYHISAFVALFELSGMLFFLSYSDTGGRKGALLCGACTALALLTKQSAVFLLPVYALGLFFEGVKDKHRAIIFLKYASAGLVIVSAAALAYVIVYGNPHSFIDRILFDHLRNTGQTAIKYELSSTDSKLDFLSKVFYLNPLLWFLGLMAALYNFRSLEWSKAAAVSLWASSFLLMLFLVGHIWDHYLMESTAPIAVLSSQLAFMIFSDKRKLKWLPASFIILLAVASALNFGEYYSKALDSKTSLDRQLEAAEYIKNATPEGQAMLVVGLDSYYVLTSRPWPTEYLRSYSNIVPDSYVAFTRLGDFLDPKETEDFTRSLGSGSVIYLGFPEAIGVMNETESGRLLLEKISSDYREDESFARRFGNNSGYLFIKNEAS